MPEGVKPFGGKLMNYVRSALIGSPSVGPGFGTPNLGYDGNRRRLAFFCLPRLDLLGEVS